MASTDPGKQIELLETVRKKRAALEARLRKVPKYKIAEQLGVSVNTITAWIEEMTVTMLPPEQAELLRAHEAAGIDVMEARSHDMIDMLVRQATRKEQSGLSVDYETEQIAKWQEHISRLKAQRSKLLGLDTPVLVKHNVIVRTEFDAEVEALTSDLCGGGNLLTPPDMVDTGDEE